MPPYVRARPSVAPPLPPAWEPSGGGDGGEPFRIPWWLVAVVVVMASVCLYGMYRVAILSPRRPLTILVAFIAAASAGWYAYRLDRQVAERFQSRVIASGIVGGMIGELAHYAVVGVPLSVPSDAGWVLVGAGGIGGLIGVGIGLLVSLTWVTSHSAWILWRLWRRPAA